MISYKTVKELCRRQVQSTSRPLHDACCLHYNGPGSTGFGVKRTAMLLPESAMLMVSPMGCGRSGSVVAERYGFSDRMFYLNLDDRSIASGAYLKEIPKAVRYIAELGRFRVVMICMTCVDALTGTDLEGLGKKISRDIGIPVTTTFMDPIVRDGNFGPMVQVRKAITDCFTRDFAQRDAINLLGVFAPLAAGSELHAMLRAAGIHSIRTVAGCRTFAQLQQMGNSRCSVVVHPQAVACGNDLQKRLGLPFISLLTAYAPERIAADYEALGHFLGAELQYAPYKEAAQQELLEFSQTYRGKRIAVGEAVCGSPFEIAALLLSLGIQVPFVFRDRILAADRAPLERLVALAPDLPVFSGVHPETFTNCSELPAADLVLGLDAGYFLPDAISVAWPFEETHYGYDAVRFLLRLLKSGFACPRSHREQMTGSYLTV